MPEPLICPQCGAANHPSATSCFNCGWAPSTPAPVQAAAGADSGHRTAIVVGSILGGALVLGVAVALVLQFVVLNGPDGDSEPIADGTAEPHLTHAAPASPTPTTTSKTSEASTKPTSTKPTPTKKSTPNYKTLYTKTKSGVFKVLATGCGHDGSKIGTAYLIGKDQAIAAYSSLARSGVFALTDGRRTIPATVAGVDSDAGIVRLKLSHAVKGHHFKIAGAKPRKQDPLGMIGVPADKNATKLQTSTIVDTSTSARIADTKIDGLAEAKTPRDPGVAGAPVLNADGKVAGMALASRSSEHMMVLPGSVLKKKWSAHGSMPNNDCGNPRGPDATRVSGHAPKKIKTALEDYFEGINSGDYRQAFDKLSKAGRGGLTYPKMRNGWQTTYDFNITVQHASGHQAYVSFNSISDKTKSPDKNRTCARWNINYHFVSAGGELLIDHVSTRGGHQKLWSTC